MRKPSISSNLHTCATNAVVFSALERVMNTETSSFFPRSVNSVGEKPHCEPYFAPFTKQTSLRPRVTGSGAVEDVVSHSVLSLRYHRQPFAVPRSAVDPPRWRVPLANGGNERRDHGGEPS